MFKKALFAGLVSVSMFAVGCGGNACEKAADKFNSKLEECGVTTGTADADADGEEAECTDAAAKLAETYSNCIDKASCDDVKAGTWAASCQ